MLEANQIDIITVKSELTQIGKFETVGGLEYLASLPDKVPVVSNIENYIQIVEEKSILRKLIKASNEISQMGYEQTEETERIMGCGRKKDF